MELLKIYEKLHERDVNDCYLCHIFEDNNDIIDGVKYREYFKLFKPNSDERKEHCREEGGYVAWGSYGEYNEERVKYKFNPFRQNIVLFMAAMAGEL
jgi:hypothetical protein